MIAQGNTSWPGTYHVGADCTIDVTETNYHSESDTTFVGSLHIVGNPSDRVGNVGIDTTSREEHANVGQSGVPGGDEDDVTSGANTTVEAVRNNNERSVALRA